MYNHSLEYLRFILDLLSYLFILVLEFQFLPTHVISKSAKRRLAVLLACYCQHLRPVNGHLPFSSLAG